MKSIKKLLAVVLSLAMVLGSLTVTALADDITWIPVSSAQAMKDAFATATDGGDTVYVKVTQRIGQTSDVNNATVASGASVVLDLNGHTIGLSNKSKATNLITNNGTLTIIDGTGSKTSGMWMNSSNGIPIANNGTLNIENGIYTHFNAVGISIYYDSIPDYLDKTAGLTLTGASIINTGTINVDGDAAIANDIDNEADLFVTTGYFCFDPTDYLVDPSHYEVVDDTERFGCSYLAKLKTASDTVAVIGTTEYTSLQDAFDAVENGEEIVLMDDITLTDRITTEDGLTDATVKEFTLNMNKKTITYTGSSTGSILMRKYNHLTITGDGKFDIQSGNYYFSTNQSARLYIESGDFTTGKIKPTYTSYKNTLGIKGGTWSVDPNNLKTKEDEDFSGVAEGYYAQFRDGIYTVVNGAEASINGVEYDTLAEAAEALGSKAGTVKILHDITLSERVNFTGKDTLSEDSTKRTVTVDLAGNNITTSYASGIFGINKNATLTITDTSDTPGTLTTTSDAVDRILTYMPSSTCKVNIKAGTWLNAAYFVRQNEEGKDVGKLAITGGSYDKDPSNYLGLGAYVEEADNLWNVKQRPFAVTVNDGAPYYPETIQDAISYTAQTAATNGDVATIDIFKDVTDLSARLNITNAGTSLTNDKTKRTVNINLNGHKIKSSYGSGVIGINTNGTLNIYDEDNSGSLTGPSSYLVYTSTSSIVTYNGGTYDVGKQFLRTNDSGAKVGTLVINAGVFDKDPATYVNPESKCTTDGKKWTVTAPEPVLTASVKVGDEEAVDYYSMDEAWIAANANEGSVLTLQRDINTNASLGNVTASFTLDLNNHKISCTSGAVCTVHQTLTIGDFSAEKGGMIEYVGTLGSTSHLFIEAKYSSSLGSGKLIIQSGTIADNSANGHPKGLVGNIDGSATATTINGGTISAAGHTAAYSLKTPLNFNGGRIIGDIVLATPAEAKAVINLAGGTFDFDPTELPKAVLAAKKMVQDNGDDTFSIVDDTSLPVICEVDGKKYSSVNAAIADILAVGNEGTITFIDDVYGADPILVPGEISVSGNPLANITFDLNGLIIQRDEAGRLFNLKDGTFTITNGTIYPQGNPNAGGIVRFENAKADITEVTFEGDTVAGAERKIINQSSGGAYYINSSDITFTDCVVENCAVAKESDGKYSGNSGAMHITNASNVIFVNTEINNCGGINMDQTGQGAVSVGSYCTLTLDEDSRFIGCSAEKGGAIYVDIKTDGEKPVESIDADHTAGQVYAYSQNFESCESYSAVYLSSAPIYSRGFVYIDGALTNQEPVCQLETNARLLDEQMILSADLTFKVGYEVTTASNSEWDVPQSHAGMTPDHKKFVVLVAGEEVPEKNIVDEINGTEGTLTIKGITAAQMAETISISYMLVDDADEQIRLIANPYDTTIVEYCKQAYEEGNDALNTLLADTLNYGKEVQKFWTGSEGTAVVIPEELVAFVTTNKPQKTDTVRSAEQINPKHYIKSATLNLNDKVALRFDLFGSKSAVKLTCQVGEGEEIDVTEQLHTYGDDGTFSVYLDKLTPLQYSDTYTMRLYSADGQTLYSTVVYSVNSYCYQKQADNLARAIFNYGLAATNFVKNDAN